MVEGHWNLDRAFFCLNLPFILPSPVFCLGTSRLVKGGWNQIGVIPFWGIGDRAISFLFIGRQGGKLVQSTPCIEDEVEVGGEGEGEND